MGFVRIKWRKTSLGHKLPYFHLVKSIRKGNKVIQKHIKSLGRATIFFRVEGEDKKYEDQMKEIVTNEVKFLQGEKTKIWNRLEEIRKQLIPLRKENDAYWEEIRRVRPVRTGIGSESNENEKIYVQDLENMRWKISNEIEPLQNEKRELMERGDEVRHRIKAFHKLTFKTLNYDRSKIPQEKITRIQELTEKTKMSYSRIAEELGVNKNTVTKYSYRKRRKSHKDLTHF